ncbi:hypothetical protein HDU67_003067, partial [Dinochytrium kinnereticum]
MILGRSTVARASRIRHPLTPWTCLACQRKRGAIGGFSTTTLVKSQVNKGELDSTTPPALLAHKDAYDAVGTTGSNRIDDLRVKGPSLVQNDGLDDRKDAMLEFGKTIQALQSLRISNALLPEGSEMERLGRANRKFPSNASHPSNHAPENEPRPLRIREEKAPRRNTKLVSKPSSVFTFEAGQDPNTYEVQWWRSRMQDFDLVDKLHLRASRIRTTPQAGLDVSQTFLSNMDQAVSSTDSSALARLLTDDLEELDVTAVLRCLSLLRNDASERSFGAIFNKTNEDYLTLICWRLFKALQRIPGGLTGLTKADWQFLIKTTVFNDMDSGLGYARQVGFQKILDSGVAVSRSDITEDPYTASDVFSIPEASVRSMLLLKEMKASGTTPDDKMYAALIRSQYRDPRKVIATHRHVMQLARGTYKGPHSSNLPSSIPFLTDFYTRQLLYTLMDLRPVLKLEKPPEDFDRDDGRNLEIASRESLIERVWDEMKEMKTRPSRWTCVAFLEAFGRSRNKVMVENVHRALILDRKAKNGEGDWGKEVFAALMRAHE